MLLQPPSLPSATLSDILMFMENYGENSADELSIKDEAGKDEAGARALDMGSFTLALFTGAVRSFFVEAFLFSILFVSAAAAAAYFIGERVEWHLALELAAAASFVAASAAVGVFSGTSHAAAGTVLRAIEGVEEVLHRLADQVVEAVEEKIPHHVSSVTIESFEERVEVQIEKVARGAAARASFFSPAAFFSGFLTRAILKGLRFAFMKDFTEGIRAKGREEVTAADMENYARRFVVSVATENLKFTFELIRYGVYAVAALMLSLPFIAFLF